MKLHLSQRIKVLVLVFNSAVLGHHVFQKSFFRHLFDPKHPAIGVIHEMGKKGENTELNEIINMCVWNGQLKLFVT